MSRWFCMQLLYDSMRLYLVVFVRPAFKLRRREQQTCDALFNLLGVSNHAPNMCCIRRRELSRCVTVGPYCYSHADEEYNSVPCMMSQSARLCISSSPPICTLRGRKVGLSTRIRATRGLERNNARASVRTALAAGVFRPPPPVLRLQLPSSRTVRPASGRRRAILPSAQPSGVARAYVRHTANIRYCRAVQHLAGPYTRKSLYLMCVSRDGDDYS
jgi:hypothetical protein